MNSLKSDITFKSRCPEIRLGQQVCRTVNNVFPHYSLSKFNPMIEKHLTKVKSPQKVLWKVIEFNNERPGKPENYYNNESYIGDLFSFIDKFHCFNCQESAILSLLILKLNGIKNAYNAFIRNGLADSNHAVCIFNRDGSELVPCVKGGKETFKIENNKTIIVDPWTGICDFANNAFNEYHGFWNEHLKPEKKDEPVATGIYNFDRIQNIDFSEAFLESVRKEYPNLIIKNVPQKKG